MPLICADVWWQSIWFDLQIRLKMGQAYYFVTELINTSDDLFGIWLTIKLLIMGM